MGMTVICFHNNNEENRQKINAGKAQLIFQKTSHYNEMWRECARPD